MKKIESGIINPAVHFQAAVAVVNVHMNLMQSSNRKRIKYALLKDR